MQPHLPRARSRGWWLLTLSTIVLVVAAFVTGASSSSATTSTRACSVSARLARADQDEGLTRFSTLPWATKVIREAMSGRAVTTSFRVLAYLILCQVCGELRAASTVLLPTTRRCF
jgi:hypothetical protein